MQTVTFELQSNIANRIDAFIQLFGSKEVMFDKFLEYHIKKLKREIALMQIDLNKYELKYKMSSSKFYKQIEKGKLGDSKDFILWSGIYETHLSCKQKLKKMI